MLKNMFLRPQYKQRWGVSADTPHHHCSCRARVLVLGAPEVTPLATTAITADAHLLITWRTINNDAGCNHLNGLDNFDHQFGLDIFFLFHIIKTPSNSPSMGRILTSRGSYRRIFFIYLLYIILIRPGGAPHRGGAVRRTVGTLT